MLYVWADVALVYVLCAIPLGMLLGEKLGPRFRRSGSFVLGVLLLGWGIAVFGSGSIAPEPSPLLDAFARGATALGLALAVALFWFAFRGGPRPGQSGKNGIAFGTVSLAALVILPLLYVSERNRHDLARMTELLDQSRLGEARSLSRGLAVLAPHAECKGRPVVEWAGQLARTVGKLESIVADPLWAGAPAAERFERARTLAILGRTPEALDALTPVNHPAADNLRGTIHQSQQTWESSLASYEAARRGWTTQPASDARTAELLRATRGIAFAQRRLGRYAEAERTYQEVLALAPTADTHFLLAQFYEDAQDAKKARNHAHLAMSIDPARYQQAGESLIRKLTEFHFGCLGVFWVE